MPNTGTGGWGRGTWGEGAWGTELPAVTATGVVGTVFIWGLVDTAQTPSWQDVTVS